MLNVFATGVLLLAVGNASAAWTAINSTNGINEYIDRNTIRHSAKTVKMWTLTDYEAPRTLPSGDEYSSRVALREFDCVEQRSRVLQMSTNSGRMREGKEVFSSTSAFDWDYAEPGTVGEMRMEIACKRK